jgi:hypothetical protein
MSYTYRHQSLSAARLVLGMVGLAAAATVWSQNSPVSGHQGVQMPDEVIVSQHSGTVQQGSGDAYCVIELHGRPRAYQCGTEAYGLGEVACSGGHGSECTVGEHSGNTELRGLAMRERAAASQGYTYSCADGSDSITLSDPPPYGPGSAYRDFFYACGKMVVRGGMSVGENGQPDRQRVRRERTR